MKTRSDFFVPYMFLLPAISLLIIFNFIPAIETVRESVYAASFRRGVPPVYVGLDNFRRIFDDPVFWKSVRVTLWFSLLVNPLQTILALGLALIANQRVRGIGFFRSVYLLPVAVSINVTVVVWGLMVDAWPAPTSFLDLTGSGLEHDYHDHLMERGAILGAVFPGRLAGHPHVCTRGRRH